MDRPLQKREQRRENGQKKDDGNAVDIVYAKVLQMQGGNADTVEALDPTGAAEHQQRFQSQNDGRRRHIGKVTHTVTGKMTVQRIGQQYQQPKSCHGKTR